MSRRDNSCRLCTYKQVYDVGQSGWITAARVPLPFLSSSHTRTTEYERERSQIEKRREINARYTRRRHLQKVEKQERKRAVFCTIVKSTDGREIDGVASANLRREK